MTARCILLGEELSQANDCRAHVIPSALGGRLKPKGLLSKRANQVLNDRIDAPLVRTLAPIMALVGGSRDRGDNEAVRLSTSQAESYLVNYGRPMELASPVYHEVIDDKAITVSIRASSAKEVRTLLGRLKKRQPDFDTDAAMAEFSVETGYLREGLQGRMSFGPDPVFPASFTAASIFAASIGQPVHPDFASYVDALPDRKRLGPNGMDLSVPMPPDTFYWLPDVAPVSAPEGLTHVVAYRGDPERGAALVYIEYFNLAGVAVRLPFNGSQAVTATYSVDVLTGKTRSIELNGRAFERPWCATHTLMGGVDFLRPGIENILRLTFERTRERELDRIIREEWGDGEFLTPDRLPRIIERVVEMVMATQMLRRPSGSRN